MPAAIYPGTFDPPTLGHVNVALRAVKHFDHLMIAVGKNSAKTESLFSVEERVALLQTVFHEEEKIEVVSFKGLLIDFAKKQKISIALRGVRSILDFEYEEQQAQLNRRLGGLETFYLPVDEHFRALSGTLIREIAAGGGSLEGLVPKIVEEALVPKLSTSQN